ncbi:yjeF C-terminal region, hydroxyethylthiazole kinase-related/yjeF N-terminal region [Frankineae bacterium MT45]|nr:yjeF C-terminal region, hydroxyethylthiazole kinase-related/yjeF N-terminal region [Frankineae bacterium MT45]
MEGVYSVAQIRGAEEQLMAQLPDGALMARASTALATVCARQLRARAGGLYGSSAVLLVGSGNNGADALYAGAILARRGVCVSAALLDQPRTHEAALAAFRAAGGRVAAEPAAILARADLVLDGILGIGGRGALRPEAAELVAAIGDGVVVAVDIPSGVDADSGVVEGACVTADVTVTFGGLKAGLISGAGAARSGQVQLVDIGLDLPEPQLRVLEAADVAALLRQPTETDDKYTRGVVGVIAGSAQYSGAGLLATGSARHGGAGMVRYLGTAPEQIRAHYPDVVVHEATEPGQVRVQAWVIGPGIGTDADARSLLAQTLATDVPVLVDADGITLLAQEKQLLAGRRAATLLTPHDREFERLAGRVSGDRIASARRAARELDVTLLLKGDATVIASPDGTAFVNPTGTPWLGSAGTGDVLSGLVGALLATGLPTQLAAAVGAYLHGVAGQIAGAGGNPNAADVLAKLPAAVASVRG